MHQNRKIDAIKLLREETGVGLKEAKELVETYAVDHPELIEQRTPMDGSLLTILTGLSLIGAIGYVAYRVFV